ncbi:ASKHA domain-containing protein [Desulfosporosinus fructosivorans]
MRSFTIVFQPGGYKTEVPEGRTIKEAMNQAGLEGDFPCGGMGKCGKCRVHLTKGTGSPTDTEREALEPKDLEAGFRLACMTEVHEDMEVELPYAKKLDHNILVTSVETVKLVKPHLNKLFIEVDKPTLQEHHSDWDRLKGALVKQTGMDDPEVPISVLRQLPNTLRDAKHHVTAIMYGNKLLGLEQGDTTATMLGMAFDIGTTTIVGYLIELYTGKEIAVVSALNPQTRFGADVISRITYAGEKDGLNQLHSTVISTINSLIEAAAEMARVGTRDIYAVSIAGNTTMHHLFLGLNPQNIALAPFVGVVTQGMAVDAAELGLAINQAGKVFVLPTIAGFVGGDTTAVLLATGLEHSTDLKLVIDIGTNGEIALGSKEKIVVCSAAAGPAFEGAEISSGMRGAEGAIDHVHFGSTMEYSVIGEGKPSGICGSALIDIVAGLLDLGLIDKKGRILASHQVEDHTPTGEYRNRLIEYGGEGAFLLVKAEETAHGRPIMLTQNDIEELQLAKAAMASGISILMEVFGVHPDDVSEVLLAGAFGNYLKPASACKIGLIPQELEQKIRLIGNAAGTGSKIALMSANEFKRANIIAASTRFVELGSFPGFRITFAKNYYFS